MEFKTQESIAFLLRQAFWGFKGVMNSKLKSLGHDFSMEQGGVLMRLGMNDGLPQNELAAFLGKDKTTIARLIDSMEKSLLVIRVASSVDKRIKLVYRTNKGKSVQKDVHSCIKETLGESLKGVSYEDEEITKKVLKRIFDNLELDKNDICNLPQC